nr:right-handed parallel beta-helix repeat-containing protein [Acanthopleuribacter pedis]
MIPVTVPIRILGAGAGSTVLESGIDRAFPLFDVQANFSLEGLTFNDWDEPVVQSLGATLEWLEIRGCHFSNVSHYVITTHKTQGSIHLRADNIHRFVLEDALFTNCHAALKLRAHKYLRNVTIRNNQVDGVVVAGFLVGVNGPNYQPYQTDYVITGNTVKNVIGPQGNTNEIYAIQVLGSQAVIADNLVQTVKNDTPNSSSFGIYTKMTDSIIRDNTVLDVAGAGIQVKGRSPNTANNGDNLGYGNRVTHNLIQGPHASNGLISFGIALNCSDTTLSDNMISEVDRGIYLHFDGTNNLIENNKISHFRASGIQIDQMAKGLTIRHNRIFAHQGSGGKGIYFNAFCANEGLCMMVNVLVEGNHIEAMNDQVGVYFNASQSDPVPIRNMTVRNNVIRDATYGIGFFNDGTYENVVIADNTIQATVPIQRLDRVDSYRIHGNDNGAAKIRGSFPIAGGGGAVLSETVDHGAIMTPSVEQVKVTLIGDPADVATVSATVQSVGSASFQVVLNQAPLNDMVAFWEIQPDEKVIDNNQ